MDTEMGTVPCWDLADRLRKSLRESGIGVQEMADFLGVSRGSVGNWLNGHNRPNAPTIRLWALRTGVPHGWLRHGDVSAPTTGELTEQLPGDLGQLRKQHGTRRWLGVAA